MIIRKEETKDYEIVYSIVKSAFDGAEHTDGNEYNLVNALRKVKRLYLNYHWLLK